MYMYTCGDYNVYVCIHDYKCAHVHVIIKTFTIQREIHGPTLAHRVRGTIESIINNYSKQYTGNWDDHSVQCIHKRHL